MPFPPSPYVVRGLAKDKLDAVVPNALAKLVNLTKNTYGTPSNGGMVKTASDGSFAINLANLGDYDIGDKVAVSVKYPGKIAMHAEATSGGYMDIGTMILVRQGVL